MDAEDSTDAAEGHVSSRQQSPAVAVNELRLLEVYQKIGELVLSSLDRDTVLANLATALVKAGIFRSLMIALVDEKNHSVQVMCGFGNRYVDGNPVPYTAVKSTQDLSSLIYDLDDENITAEVARSGQMQVVEEWDDRFDSKLSDREARRGHAAYFIPVKKGERVLGVLATGSSLEDKDQILQTIDTMEPLFNQVAIALEHAQLYRELGESRRAFEWSLRREEAMGRISNKIIAMRDISQVPSELMPLWKAELIALGIPINNTSIQLPVEDDKDVFTFIGSFEEIIDKVDERQRFRLDETPWVRSAWQSGKTVRVSPEEISGGQISPTVQSLIEVPMLGGGSMGINSREPDAFDEATIQVVEPFVQLAASGLQRIRAFVELARANDELALRAKHLERSNRDLEEFAYVASHDLQEPLRMVSSYMELLQRRYQGQLDEKADRFIFYAVDGAQRMKDLINDLLDYSRVNTEGGEFIRVDSAQILEQTLADLQLAIEEADAEITWGAMPVVVADPVQLGQLLQNLVANALKFSCQETPRIHIGVERRGSEWIFCVKDNGIGIEAQFAERIFSVFKRLHTRQEYEGMGIGLSICKKIIERHEGKIWVESELGHGARFFFTMRAASSEA